LFKSSRARQLGGRLATAIFLLLGVSVAIFMGVLPLLEGSLISLSTETADRISGIRGIIMQAAIVGWFAAVGGSIGSFMNVVVWRMPRGESVLAKSSACPRCLARIRLADNLPVIGWLRLGGRCRTCRLPISSRYPVVEVIYLLLFLILFAAIIPVAGANLPNGPFSTQSGIISNTLSGKGVILAVFAFHAFWLSLAVSWALFEMDGNRIPLKLIALAAVGGFSALLIRPELLAVLANGDLGVRSEWTTVLASGATGMIAGALAGWFLDERARRANRNGVAKSSGRAFFSVLLTSGLFTGWQATGTVLALAGLLAVAGNSIIKCKLPGGQHFPYCGYFAAVAAVHVCVWRALHALIAPYGNPMFAGLFLAGIGLFAVAISTRMKEPAGILPTCEMTSTDGNNHE
jgi:leader peptidase (prepilin peptidase) / N-methyltransferase